MERTLVLIKPDALQRGLAGEIITRLERRGLKIVALKVLQMDQALAQRHYRVHQGKVFFPGLVRFITSSPIISMVWEGPRAVEAVRSTMGTTDPVRAGPGTIRGDLGLDMGRNLVHGSDSLESAKEEIALFFREEEIISYQLDRERWIIES
ncbi:MAG: nucleoside-diphosphate kinase [Chloroflexota bacterium]|nr:nucleoside-diphosphate kinase [Chloroflexota bacterium]